MSGAPASLAAAPHATPVGMPPSKPRLFGKEVKNLGGKRILATYHVTVLDPPPGWRGPARTPITPATP